VLWEIEIPNASSRHASEFEKNLTLTLWVDWNGDKVWDQVYPRPNDKTGVYNSIWPTSDGGYVLTGQVYGNYQKVQWDMYAAKIDSTNVELTRLLTQMYYGTRDYAKAVEAYGRLAALDTLSAREYVDWGRSYQALKQNASAITALEKAVAMDSTLDLHFDIGTLLYNEQRYPEAIAHYEKKVQADSQSVGTYLTMGFSYIRQQKYADAVKAFRKGVELKPDDLQGHLWLAQSYAMLDDLEQAKNEYMVVAKLDSADAASRRYIGFYHLMKKQYPSAISYLQRSVALDSGDAQAHLWLAQAFLLNHQGDQALVEYRRVLQLDPSNKEAQKRVKILE
jgi:tetratricopeptide (TPR) repeat protein